MTTGKVIQLAVILTCACMAAIAQRLEEPLQNAVRANVPNEENGSQNSVTKGQKENRPTAKADDPASGSGSKGKNSQPHIIMIVVDDLGWNDVNWRDQSLHTPVINQLAKEGMVLNHSYVQPVCSPSRAAFLSGFYPYHLGLQHDSLRATQKAYLPGSVTTLPQHLQKLGYRTHMAGKWHLGFCNWRYTPTYRGFDSFVGFYNAIQDYYTHIGHHDGYDFRYNESVYYEANGTYSAFIFTQHIQKVIDEHDVSKPLFVYLPYQSVHGPLQVPQVYTDKYCSHIHDNYRRTKCGMIAVLDEGIGNITGTLKNRDMWNDTLLVFTTDNGGPVNEGANNWPLRGSKTTLWEGGTRALAFLHGPRFLGPKSQGATYDGVIHAVDWLPTLVEAAGGKVEDMDANLDGVSQWQSLVKQEVPSARNEFVYNIDELKNNSALRQGKYKLLQGNPGKPDKWYPPPSLLQAGPFLNILGERYFAGARSGQDILSDMLSSQRSYEEASRLYNSLLTALDYLLRGPQNPDPQASGVVNMWSEDDVMKADKYQLYDLDADPNEHHDIKDKYPEVFKRMRARLDEYRKSLVPANFPPHDPDALPSHFHGVWSPGWC